MDINKALIKFIRQNSGLYNPVHKNYKNVRYKNRKWQEIASKLNINADAVRKRWRCIRDRYKRISREQNLNGTEYKLNNYKYAPLLTFLDDTLTNHQESTTNGEYHLTISNATTCNDDNLTDTSDESRQFDSKDDIIQWSPVMSSDETTASNEHNQNDDGMLKFVEEILIPETNAENFNISSSNIKEEEEKEQNDDDDDDEQEKKKKYYAKSKEISFCENLAIQLNVANLPIAIFSKFQFAVYAAFQEAVCENESKSATRRFQAENKKRR